MNGGECSLNFLYVVYFSLTKFVRRIFTAYAPHFVFILKQKYRLFT